MDKNKLGLIHVYAGDGKGKTTASAGLALRAIGNGMSVYVLQFMKAESDVSGEMAAILNLPNITVERFGGNLLKKKHAPVEEIKANIGMGLKKAHDAITRKQCDLVILDEINVAMSMGLVEISDVVELAKLAKEQSVELVMTGRKAPQVIIDIADYVTEMKSLKHPYSNNIQARRGIEF